MPSNTNDFLTKLPEFHRALRAWYRLHGRRELPWRRAQTAYEVYISEVMLQQTQVKTVLEKYYFPFLERFPTLAALASAPVQDVLKAWEGLGYYTRARNLHKAAQTCMGELPSSVEGLMALPGIGRNTAHAVASFGFGRAVPVMEANVKRVLARVLAMEALDEGRLWQVAEQLLDKEQSFDYNQAMMDIGALVCTRRAPRCGECPVAAICVGRGAPESYPARKATKPPPTRERVALIIYSGKRVFVIRRASRFLGGLYGFPEGTKEQESIEVGGINYLLSKAICIGQVTQSYSHFTLEAEVLLASAVDKATGPIGGGQWVTLQELEALPLSRADRKMAHLLGLHVEEEQGKRKKTKGLG